MTGDQIDGTIVYTSRDDHTPPAFAKMFAALAQRHPTADLLHVVSNDIADARNKAVLQARGAWIWFIDPDMAFAPTTIERLLAHDVDVVQPLCLMRHPPHVPILFLDSADVKAPAPIGLPRLVEVQSLGAGGTLYRFGVFQHIAPPWFEGVLGREDTAFAAKLKAAGIPLYCDLGTPVGHLTPIYVWPTHLGGGEWRIRYDAMTGAVCQLPFQQGPRVRPATDEEARHVLEQAMASAQRPPR